jgi:hypothetical protein
MSTGTVVVSDGLGNGEGSGDGVGDGVGVGETVGVGVGEGRGVGLGVGLGAGLGSDASDSGVAVRKTVGSGSAEPEEHATASSSKAMARRTNSLRDPFTVRLPNAAAA